MNRHLIAVLKQIVAKPEVLYHFTTLEGLGGILSSMNLKGGYNRLYKEPTVSLTRDSKLQQNISHFANNVVRIEIDKATLSKNYKIVPYKDPNFENESEEIVILKNKALPLKGLVNRIDILTTNETKKDPLID
jgi:hypothetical protein